MQVFLAFILAILAIPCAPAQEPQIIALASQMTDAITHANVKTVVLFDFIGPGDKMTALGQKLADDFRIDLGKSGTAFKVIEATQIQDALKENRFAPSVLVDVYAQQWLTQELKAEAFTQCELSLQGDNLEVIVRLYRVADRHIDKEFKAAIPLTDETKRLLSMSVNEDATDSYPSSGTKGNSYPACLYCPPAQFTDEAVRSKIQGVVRLLIVVDEDGRARNIRVMKALPDGLTFRAILAVRSWRFRPAIGPDGAPVSVRQIVEVSFHLSNQETH